MTEDISLISILGLLLVFFSSTGAVTLSGSSEYAVVGSPFTLTCDVPDGANNVTFYRTPPLVIGSIRVVNSNCVLYNQSLTLPCEDTLCACEPSAVDQGRSFNLTITPTTQDHSSTWFCGGYQSWSSNNTAYSPDYILQVAKGPGAGLSISPFSTRYTGNEGYSVPDITCTADCRPRCSYVWTKPDNTNITSSVLALRGLSRAEDGTYRCTARNEYGTNSITVTVVVNYSPGASVALSPSTNLYIRNEGDILPDITCTADCRPSCLFFWTMPNNSNFTTSPLLSLGQLSRTEHGHYICNAWNGVGSATREINVTVQYGPALSVALSPPDFLYTRNEGATLPAITCAADCRPSCLFVWTKPDNTNFTISAVLSLGQLDRSEHGRYVCHAWNGVSSATEELSVTVQYGPGNSITYRTSATLDRLENQSVPDITCDADCRPPCSYSWSKDNSQYPNPLSLSVASRSNAGTYRCRASNAVSDSVKDWTLVVRYPPKILSLGYTQGNADVKENETKSLSCKVESYPPSNITWYYKVNNTVLLIAPGATDSTFTLTKAGCLDTGFYTCSAKNSVSSSPSTSDIHVNVLCKPRIDSRLNTIVKVGIGLSRDLVLTASYLSNPEPKFTWQFHMEGITENLVHGKERVSIRSTYSNSTVSAVSTITRTRMEERWLGIYIVTVANDQGSDTLVYTVTAADKPNSPYEGKVDCPFTNRAILSWTSDFNGGSEQKFVVGMKGDPEGFFVINTNMKYDDPGRGQAVEAELSDLSPDSLYFFTVIAINEYGNASLVDEVNCTTTAIPPVEDSNTAGIVAGVVVSVLIIAIIAVALFIFRRKIFQFLKKDDETEMPSSGKQTNDTYDSLDPEQVAAPNIYDQMHPNVTANQDNEGNINRDPRGLQEASNESHRYVNVEFEGHDPIYENTTANAAKPAAKKMKRKKKRKNET